MSGADTPSFVLSAVLSPIARLIVGSLMAWTAGKSVPRGGLRMLLAGGAAAAVTFGIGSLIGASLLD